MNTKGSVTTRMRRPTAVILVCLSVIAAFTSCRRSSDDNEQSYANRVFLETLPNGTANVVADESRRVSVRVEGYGFPASRSLAVRILGRDCLGNGRGPTLSVGTVRADSDGNVAATATTPVPVSGGLPEPASVRIEDPSAGRGDSSVPASLLTCSDLNRRRSTSSVRLFAPPGRKPGGFVDLRSRGGDVTVRYNLVGLGADSTHAVTVARGTCRSLGDELTELKDVRAGADEAVKRTDQTDDLTLPPASDAAFVVHAGAAPDSAAILCGDVPETSATPTPQAPTPSPARTQPPNLETAPPTSSPG